MYILLPDLFEELIGFVTSIVIAKIYNIDRILHTDIAM